MDNQAICLAVNSGELDNNLVEHETPEKMQEVSIVSREWVPNCDDKLRPRVGMEFDSLEACEKFYKSYAGHVGFSVRKGSHKKIKGGTTTMYQYFLCSKEGFRLQTSKPMDKEKTRKRKQTREGCNAMIAFKMKDGKYSIYKFEEPHTHLLATPSKQHMLRSNRAVTSVHRELLRGYACANIGPSKAHDIMKEQVGGFHNIGCTKQDLKNFQRDLKTFIKDSDADMFVGNFRKKREVNPSFYIAYKLDDDGALRHVFWVDGISRKNYALYGDVVSFDTTYDTNRYKMVFAPFTGVDKHRHCVAFGAALLGDEKAESFIWLFEKFLDAMGHHKPFCIITDQDPAMKVAIERVLDTFVHRFCLWHIMKKLSEKVGVALCGDPTFNNRFNSCVYKSKMPEEFEKEWKSIVDDFRLERNDWLAHMYGLRGSWIPAYFKDVYSGSVLRTTSRSESENNFFSNFTSPHLSLVEFWMRFESAMELQRHCQLISDYEVTTSMPTLRSDREIEKHAGIPCRHILSILKAKGLNQVPDYYTLSRWTKMAKTKPLFDFEENVFEGCSMLARDDRLIFSTWTKFMECMELAGRDSKKITMVFDGIGDICKRIGDSKGNTIESTIIKTKELEAFIGSSAPEKVEILPPRHVSTKGSGKRIKGGKEKAMEQQERRKRLCRSCGELAYHDSRNRPMKENDDWGE